MIKDALLVFRLLVKSTFGDRLKNNKKFSPKIMTAVLALLLGAYVAFLALTFTFGTAKYDNQGLIAGAFIGVAQMIVLVLGIFAVINVLYFSKDTMLLSSLPVKSSAIFLAKIMLIYLMEIGISTLISVPALLTIGIYRAVTGVVVSIGYFVYTVLSVVLIPIIPLLIVSVLSLPLMYIVSYIKKHGVASVVFSVVVAGIAVAVVLAMQIYVNSGAGFNDADDEVAMQSMLALFTVINRILIFNYPLRMAMTVGNATSILWFLAYFLIGVFSIAVSLVISSKLYAKVLGKGLENGSNHARKSRGELVYETRSFRRTFIVKELRTFVKTPALFINLIIPVIIMPIAMCILVFSMGQVEADETAYFDPNMVYMPMMFYIAVMMTCFGNFLAMVGFSREGKNFIVLKTLPISATDVVQLKSALALCANAFLSVVSGISVLIGLLVARSSVAFCLISSLFTLLVCMVFGSAYDLLALNNDMKKLNINWQNLSEITKKNPNIVGIQMFVIVLSLVMMIVLGVGLALLPILGLTTNVALTISMSVCLVISLLALTISVRKINKNPQKWFDEVEV